MCEGTREELVKIVTVKEFKRSCLKMIDDVEATGCTYVITKDGKPFVRMIPAPRQAKTQPAK